MNGVMNENVMVKVYEFDHLLIQKIESLIDNSIRDCLNKYFHTFDHICEHDLFFTNITSNETVSFTISDKSMGLIELNKKLTVARGNDFLFHQINKVTIKIYSNLQSINIRHYLKHRIPMGQRLFFRRISQKKEYIENFCKDGRNPFHFACRQRYSYNNPQCNMV